MTRDTPTAAFSTSGFSCTPTLIQARSVTPIISGLFTFHYAKPDRESSRDRASDIGQRICVTCLWRRDWGAVAVYAPTFGDGGPHRDRNTISEF